MGSTTGGKARGGRAVEDAGPYDGDKMRGGRAVGDAGPYGMGGA